MNARLACFKILRKFDSRAGDLSFIIDRTIDDREIDRRDRRLVYEIVHGVVRHRITIDYLIDQYLTDERLRENECLIRILEIGIYQILHLDKVPNHAAVNESVNLAKTQHNTQRFTGVVNAVLRSVIADRNKLPMPKESDDLNTRLSVEYSHPVWMIRRWLANYGLARVRKLLTFNNQLPELYFRRKLRGISRQAFEADSRDTLESSGGFNQLYYRLTAKGMIPMEIRLFADGLCTVQAPPSGWAVALLDIQSGDRCLDLCSAPGGKATLMAELSGESGSVVAADIRWGRAKLVTGNAARMNLRNIYPVVCDAARAGLQGYFDKVLLDAPCSGTGVIQRHPDARHTRVESDIAGAALIQAALLNAAAGMVSNGGVLVYATCSLEPEENEQQILSFLERHDEFVREDAPSIIPQQFIDSEGNLRITPFDHSTDGMFGVRLRRKAKA